MHVAVFFTHMLLQKWLIGPTAGCCVGFYYITNTGTLSSWESAVIALLVENGAADQVIALGTATCMVVS
jgi:hypothetical protein